MNTTIVDIGGTPHSVSGDAKVAFNVFAKWVGSRYMVMASKDGDLFNPSNIDHNLHKKDRERGELFWQLRTCSKGCYRDYTVFLRSKNNVPYTLAQRRFRHDF